MTYDDGEFLRLAEQLDEAVEGLLENDSEPDDIRELVEEAITNAGAS